ncbi:MAG: acyl-CoA/acyl-ACP dehydrogenase, partial [Proteobacteria bacterium]|nr:acyl-CoA/acyl-ACP dehydrogenase [Pseudomonadota bacterium]
KQQAKEFIDHIILPATGSLRPGELPDAAMAATVRDASRQAGFFYKTQPAEFGGQPAGALELTMLRELFAAANSPLTRYIFGPGPGVLHQVQGPLAEDYLMPVLRGEKRGSFGFTEPEAAPRPTWGVLSGETLTINGQKSYVTGGAEADFVSALVNLEDPQGNKLGTAMVVIDMDARGLEVERVFSSLDGGEHVAVKFTNLVVPAHRIIGQPGDGMPRALASIGDVRLMVSAQATGMCLWVLDFIEQHLKAPHRSGLPLGDREGVRLRYADMRIETYVARSSLYRTARLVDTGDRAVNEVAATKVFTTETAGRVVDMALQLFGGQALVAGHPLERLYREVRSLRFVEGASDLLRLNIAKGRLELDVGRV